MSRPWYCRPGLTLRKISGQIESLVDSRSTGKCSLCTSRGANTEIDMPLLLKHTCLDATISFCTMSAAWMRRSALSVDVEL